MPPSASTNLPVCFSVAPVKAPFSWPNKIDSTRFSGRAPQLTATNGLARRAPLPWMARAISSLPTPDSPSISTGMAEAAAFSAALSTGCMAGERVMTSAMVSVPSCWRLSRCNSPASALVASALRSDTCSRSALAGLTTKSVAPARITDTTLSMPPWAVCTITGNVEAGVAHARQDAEAVEVGHHQVENDAVDARCIGSGEQLDRGIAAFGDDRLIAETLDHGFEEATLNRIVVDDKHDLRHETPSRTTVPNWCNVAALA